MNLAEIMKQAGQMQSKMGDVQARLEQLIVHGQSAGGLVRVTMTGKFTLRGLEINPSLMKAGEQEMLEDLIITAFADARAKAEMAAAEEMKAVTAGLPLPPGMKLPF